VRQPQCYENKSFLVPFFKKELLAFFLLAKLGYGSTIKPVVKNVPNGNEEASSLVGAALLAGGIALAALAVSRRRADSF
jgi:hypothetical protein